MSRHTGVSGVQLSQLPKRLLGVLPVVGLLVVIPIAGCGFFADPGPTTTEQRAVSGVSAVHLMTSGDLTITPGETTTLTITAGANQLPSITSDVRDGTLILDADLRRGDGISYALTVPLLTSLELSGSGNAHGLGILTGDAAVTSSGSGSVKLGAVDVDTVVVDLSGSGAVELSGSGTTQRVTASGSGSYNGSGLITRDADIDITGSGDALVNVTGQLTAKSSGSGDISYFGNPTDVTANSSGSGDIGPE